MGQPVLIRNRFADPAQDYLTRLTYDARGNTVRAETLDSEGQLVALTDGCSSIHREFDDE